MTMTGLQLRTGMIGALLIGLPAASLAQPADLPIAAARTGQYPPGIHVGKVGGRSYYLDARDRVLYGMDMRVLLPAGPDPAQYCTGDCAARWEPVLALAGAKPNIAFPRGNRPPEGPSGFYAQPQDAPDWTIIAGPQGPQWVYKGWHMVFVRKGAGGRSTGLDGSENKAWNTLKFVPPLPRIVAPADVRPVAVDGSYALADGKGRLLYTGACGKDCAAWLPFRGGMTSAGIGAWRVQTGADFAQWTWSGKPVFVCPEDAPDQVPAGGMVLRP